jgi:2,4-dienoyl-CoA reductase-like NADH-dependent reductase (Old Yellow Enzyme family)
MKTIIMIIGLLLVNESFAANNPSIKSEIEEKVQPDLTEFNFSTDHENFIVVSFKVSEYHIDILEIMGSSDYLIQTMIEELINLKVDKVYPEDDIYSFKFIFLKK